MKVARTVIADDEQLARERIRTLLAQRNDIEVVAEASSGSEAVQLIRQTQPDLLFLDVQMPELDGFQVIEAISDSTLPVIIFVTAFVEYAVDAFEVYAVDYLLKPFDRARFQQAVDRALSRLPAPDSGADGDLALRTLQLLEEIRQTSGGQKLERIVVRKGDTARFVPVADVDWFEGGGNYVLVHTGGSAHRVRGTLKALEKKLDGSRFLRVHRSAIVNVQRVREIQPWFKGDFAIILSDGTQVNTGETYRAEVRALIRNPL